MFDGEDKNRTWMIFQGKKKGEKKKKNYTFIPKICISLDMLTKDSIKMD